MKPTNLFLTLVMVMFFITESITQSIPSGYLKVATEFENALNSSDATKLGNLFTSDAVSIDSGGDVLMGSQAIQNHYKGQFSQVEYSNGKISIDEVIELAPNTYYGRGLFSATITVKANGQSVDATSMWSNVATVTSGVWKVKRHMLSIPANR